MLATGWKITPLFFGFCMVIICKAGDPSPNGPYDLSKLLQRATNYFIYEGTFMEDKIIPGYPLPTCGRWFIVTDALDAKRLYEPSHEAYAVEKKVQLVLEGEPGSSVKSSMKVNNYDGPQKGQTIVTMDLNYTDYEKCALLFYRDSGDYEVWNFQLNLKNNTECHRKLAALPEKTLTVYYRDWCYAGPRG
uniref:Putative secreted protein n=1 Tax=Ixodes scapularis TaxID=6945 RepID=Q4PMG2_IXOSC|nr:putative secreted protein [Ixodes scapularis]